LVLAAADLPLRVTTHNEPLVLVIIALVGMLTTAVAHVIVEVPATDTELVVGSVTLVVAAAPPDSVPGFALLEAAAASARTAKPLLAPVRAP